METQGMAVEAPSSVPEAAASHDSAARESTEAIASHDSAASSQSRGTGRPESTASNLSQTDVDEIKRFGVHKTHILARTQQLCSHPPVNAFGDSQSVPVKPSHGAVEVQASLQSVQPFWPDLDRRLAEVAEWQDEVERISAKAGTFEVGDMERMRQLAREASNREMSPSDTDLIEIAVQTLVALDALLRTIHARRKALDVLRARLIWEKQRRKCWTLYAALLHELEAFVVRKARWSPAVYALPRPDTSPHQTIKSSSSTETLSIPSIPPAPLSPLLSPTSFFETTPTKSAARGLSMAIKTESAILARKCHAFVHEHVAMAGRRLDEIIELNKVPETLLDEQDKLEDVAEAMQARQLFIVQITLQWAKADELFRDLRATHLRAQDVHKAVSSTLANAMSDAQACDAVSPFRPELAALRSKADHLFQSLTSLCGLEAATRSVRRRSSSGESSGDSLDVTIAPITFKTTHALPQPACAAWPEQATHNAEIAAILQMELDAAACCLSTTYETLQQLKAHIRTTEEAARQQAEAEEAALRQAEAEEVARQQAETEQAARQQAEQEAARRAAEEDAARREAADDAARQLAGEEAKAAQSQAEDAAALQAEKIEADVDSDHRGQDDQAAMEGSGDASKLLGHFPCTPSLDKPTVEDKVDGMGSILSDDVDISRVLARQGRQRRPDEAPNTALPAVSSSQRTVRRQRAISMLPKPVARSPTKAATLSAFPSASSSLLAVRSSSEEEQPSRTSSTGSRASVASSNEKVTAKDAGPSIKAGRTPQVVRSSSNASLGRALVSPHTPQIRSAGLSVSTPRSDLTATRKRLQSLSSIPRSSMSDLLAALRRPGQKDRRIVSDDGPQGVKPSTSLSSLSKMRQDAETGRHTPSMASSRPSSRSSSSRQNRKPKFRNFPSTSSSASGLPNAYRANPNSKLDVEVGKIINRLPVRVDIAHVADLEDENGRSSREQWHDVSGKYWVGNPNPRLCFCRILPSQTVMVRVGGGWEELSSFIMKHFGHLATEFTGNTSAVPTDRPGTISPSPSLRASSSQFTAPRPKTPSRSSRRASGSHVGEVVTPVSKFSTMPASQTKRGSPGTRNRLPSFSPMAALDINQAEVSPESLQAFWLKKDRGHEPTLSTHSSSSSIGVTTPRARRLSTHARSSVSMASLLETANENQSPSGSPSQAIVSARRHASSSEQASRGPADDVFKTPRRRRLMSNATTTSTPTRSQLPTPSRSAAATGKSRLRAQSPFTTSSSLAGADAAKTSDLPPSPVREETTNTNTTAGNDLQ